MTEVATTGTQWQTSTVYGMPPCARCGIVTPWGTTHYCPTDAGGTTTMRPVHVPLAPPTMWCAVCCMDEIHTSIARQVGVTQVGLLWVCGGHVTRALRLAQSPETDAPPG